MQVIATSRPALALGPAVGTGLAALQRTGRLEAVALAALSLDEVTEVVLRRTGLEPAARLVELLAERSGRTPFFLIELLDAMIRSGDLTTIDGAVDAAGHEPVALPSWVTTAVVHRVFGLGRDAAPSPPRSPSAARYRPTRRPCWWPSPAWRSLASPPPSTR